MHFRVKSFLLSLLIFLSHGLVYSSDPKESNPKNPNTNISQNSLEENLEGASASANHPRLFVFGLDGLEARYFDHQDIDTDTLMQNLPSHSMSRPADRDHPEMHQIKANTGCIVTLDFCGVKLVMMQTKLMVTIVLTLAPIKGEITIIANINYATNITYIIYFYERPEGIQVNINSQLQANRRHDLSAMPEDFIWRHLENILRNMQIDSSLTPATNPFNALIRLIQSISIDIRCLSVNRGRGLVLINNNNIWRPIEIEERSMLRILVSDFPVCFQTRHLLLPEAMREIVSSGLIDILLHMMHYTTADYLSCHHETTNYATTDYATTGKGRTAVNTVPISGMHFTNVLNAYNSLRNSINSANDGIRQQLQNSQRQQFNNIQRKVGLAIERQQFDNIQIQREREILIEQESNNLFKMNALNFILTSYCVVFFNNFITKHK